MRNRDNPLIPAVKSGDIQALTTIMAAEPTPTKTEINEAFFLACESNQLELVKRLLRYGADVDTRDRQYNKSAIIRVVEEGYLELFTFLLKEGKAAPYDGDNDEKTVLMYASDPSRLAFATLLLERQVLMDDRDKNGKTAIAYAIEKGNIKLFEWLSVDKKAALDVLDHQGRTLLMLAASVGQHTLVDRLIERGLHVDERDANEKTALMYAAESGNLETVTSLLDKGADQYVVDGAGYTALMYAIKRKSARPTAALLFQSHDKAKLDLSELLCFAAKEFEIDMFLMMLDFARSVNTNIVRETPQIFHLALEKIVLEKNMVEILRMCGVDVNAVDQQGNTPLMYAVRSQNVDAVKSLIRLGANVHAIDQDGSTPLILAAESSNPDMLEVLLANHADIRARNHYGFSALRVAVREARVSNINMLLHCHNGQQVTAEDIRESDALAPSKVLSVFDAYLKKCHALKRVIAARSLDDVQRLIAEGVNVNLPVYLAYNPYEEYDYLAIASGHHRPIFAATRHYAKGSGINEFIVLALINAGAEINVADDSGVTPLMFVAENGSKALLELMLNRGADKNSVAKNGGTVVTSAVGRSRPENLENIKYLLECGAPLNENWEEAVPKSENRKRLTSAIVDYLNEKIKLAFCDELNPDALQTLIAEINAKTAFLTNQKEARALVRTKIEECVQAFTESLEGCDDSVKMANEEKRIKALASLDILKKKPKASKEKTATLKLLDVVCHVEMLNAAAQATAESKALFETLRAWAHEKPFTDKIEEVIVNQLLNLLNEKDQGDLRRFLAAILNGDERKALKKMVYDVIEKWSKKYKLEEEQAALVLTINKIKTSYDNEMPCALFEILRTSDSGRTNVDTGTWKDFVNVMEHGNYLKKQPEKLFGLFGGRKAPVKLSENEGMFSMKLLGSNKE